MSSYYSELYLEFILSSQTCSKAVFDALPIGDRCAGKGDLIQANLVSGHPGYPSPETYWLLSSRDKYFEQDINLHFLWMAARLETCRTSMLELMRRTDLSACFGVVFSSPRLHCGGGALLNRKSLEIISAFEAELVIDAWYDEPGE